ncbi:hypothetical protein PsorP6_014341 [Peronosclerospora sorghi]|uniref:Uncharacterized protein n=1 Tax=Peronosclerospora sorghi TaxID=230839 RepID=A0ACC0VJ45_9STRA|nr:hypothetical protein PsorP6_014341 [Peronosclerospora sorghi]
MTWTSVAVAKVFHGLSSPLFPARVGREHVARLHLVNATSPEQLEWNEFSEFILNDGQFGSFFEAFDESTLVHYSINYFTGIVLTDGYACSWGLPVNIRQQKRYVSLFGHCNFEVFSTNGVFRTERKYFDRLYDFALEDEELFIQELCAEPSEKSRGRYNYVRSIGFITPNLSNATTESLFSLVLGGARLCALSSQEMLYSTV